MRTHTQDLSPSLKCEHKDDSRQCFYLSTVQIKEEYL